MAERDNATNQLKDFAQSVKVHFFIFLAIRSFCKMLKCYIFPALIFCNLISQNEATPTVTTSGGAPIGFKTASLTAGPRGPILLQDHVYTH